VSEPADRQFDVVASGRRIGAMIARYWYLLRSSWPRLLELIYWPTVQMLMWGFLQLYIGENSGFFARAGGTFIGAVLLWDILFRGQLGFSVSFLEEMWSRNLANLMISPLRPIEFVIALMVMSLVRLAIGMVPVSLLAIAFFGFNLRPRARCLLRQPDPDELGSRHLRVGPRHAQRARRRELRLDHHVPRDAARLRLLPGCSAAGLVAVGLPGFAADLRIRGYARPID
jgi:hypothetical protein